MQTINTFKCRHCHREIIFDGLWIDNNATGDDEVWSQTCDRNDSFIAHHDPVSDPKNWTLWVGGSEVNDNYLTYAAARLLADEYDDYGDDVVIEYVREEDQ